MVLREENKIKHLPYLDGLRALAALYVLFHHAMFMVQRHSFGSLPPIIYNSLEYGRYGVNLFIVLSGFCLMLPIIRSNGELKGGINQYLKRRAWRILPPYYFALAFSLLLCLFWIGARTKTQWDDSVPVTLNGVISHLFLIHDITGDDYNINYVFWSIAVEWRMYFLFPVLLAIWRKIGDWPFVLFSFLASYSLYKFLEHTLGYTLTVDFIALFVFGMYGAHVSFSKPQVGRKTELTWGIVLALMSIAVYVVSTVPFWKGHFAPNEICDFTFGFWSMAFLIFISVNENNWIRKLLSHKTIVFVGTFSYSLYLIHAPLLQLLWQYPFASLQEKPQAMFYALSFIGAPLIVAFSYFFYLGCEQPFIGRGKPKPQILAKPD